MADRKTIFVAFAIEDERQRDFLKGQSLNTRCPFEYIDMSVKEAYESDWKEKVRTPHPALSRCHCTGQRQLLVFDGTKVGN